MMGRLFSMWTMGLLALGWQISLVSAAGPDDNMGPALFPAATDGPILTVSNDASGPSLEPSPKPAARPAQHSPVERLVERPAEWQAEGPPERPVDRPAERPADRPAERPPVQYRPNVWRRLTDHAPAANQRTAGPEITPATKPTPSEHPAKSAPQAKKVECPPKAPVANPVVRTTTTTPSTGGTASPKTQARPTMFAESAVPTKPQATPAPIYIGPPTGKVPTTSKESSKPVVKESPKPVARILARKVVKEAPRGMAKVVVKGAITAGVKAPPSTPVKTVQAAVSNPPQVVIPATIRAVSTEAAPPASPAAKPATVQPAMLPTAASALAAIPLVTDPAPAQPPVAGPITMVQLPVPAVPPASAAVLPTAIPPVLGPAAFPGTSPTAIAAPVPSVQPAPANAATAKPAPAADGRQSPCLKCTCDFCSNAFNCSQDMCDRACNCCQNFYYRTCDCSRVLCDNAFDCYNQYHSQGGQFTANVGFMILAPKWGNNPASASATFFGTSGIRAQQNDFDYSTQFAPRVSLGFISGCGLGARIGWWGFGVGNGIATIPNSPAVSAAPLGLQVSSVGQSGAVLAAGSHLQLNVWDFEATENWQCGCWSLMGSAGLRYAHLAQGYVAAVYGPTGINLANLASGHNFDGCGPTASFGGKRHLGNTPFYFYGTGRSSLLFGSSNVSGLLTGSTSGGPVDAHASLDSVLPVLEMELGFGYYTSLQQRYRIFAETGVISMAWFNAGNPSGSTIAPGSGDSPMFIPTNGTLGLIGLSVRCGVNF